MADKYVDGTSLDVEVVRVIDGDTIKVLLDDEEENLRLLALDTEESWIGSRKPVTPWGKVATEKAKSFLPEGSTVTIEFPGTEPLEDALVRYRGNYGRPLVYVHKDGVDFQELMIREGYSPYFTKYGYAHFEGHHRRYREAERHAQADFIGVWNQHEVNDSEMRNYSALCTWWALRAEVIDAYRRAKHEGASNLLDSRLDYEEIEARVGEEVTVFTELRSYQRVGASHVVVTIGSQRQPFKLFLPNARETDSGQRLLSLLDERYVPGDETEHTIERPRRSYAYITGEIKLFREEPEIEVTSVDQVTDVPPG